MPRLMFQGGKLPTKEELASDDLVAQMLKDAEEKGKGEAVTKESVIQSLTAADVPDAVKQELTKDVPTKQTVIQSLSVEDVAAIPDAVRQKILEDGKIVPPVIENFVKQMIGVASSDKRGSTSEKDDEAKKSNTMKLYQTLGK